jgi:hypothetical protein
LAEKFPLSKELFLRIAEESGLGTDPSHLDSLYAYLQDVLPGLRTIEDLDLTDAEPFMPHLMKKE